jgi:hypothetical protein
MDAEQAAVWSWELQEIRASLFTLGRKQHQALERILIKDISSKPYGIRDECPEPRGCALSRLRPSKGGR